MTQANLEHQIAWIIKKLKEAPAMNGGFNELKTDVGIIKTRQERVLADVSALVEKIESEQRYRIKNGQRLTRVEEQVQSNRERILSNAKLIAMLLGCGLSGGGIVAAITTLIRGG